MRQPGMLQALTEGAIKTLSGFDPDDARQYTFLFQDVDLLLTILDVDSLETLSAILKNTEIPVLERSKSFPSHLALNSSLHMLKQNVPPKGATTLHTYKQALLCLIASYAAGKNPHLAHSVLNKNNIYQHFKQQNWFKDLHIPQAQDEEDEEWHDAASPPAEGLEPTESTDAIYEFVIQLIERREALNHVGENSDNPLACALFSMFMPNDPNYPNVFSKNLENFGLGQISFSERLKLAFLSHFRQNVPTQDLLTTLHLLDHIELKVIYPVELEDQDSDSAEILAQKKEAREAFQEKDKPFVKLIEFLHICASSDYFYTFIANYRELAFSPEDSLIRLTSVGIDDKTVRDSLNKYTNLTTANRIGLAILSKMTNSPLASLLPIMLLIAQKPGLEGFLTFLSSIVSKNFRTDLMDNDTPAVIVDPDKQALQNFMACVIELATPNNGNSTYKDKPSHLKKETQELFSKAINAGIYVVASVLLISTGMMSFVLFMTCNIPQTAIIVYSCVMGVTALLTMYVAFQFIIKPVNQGLDKLMSQQFGVEINPTSARSLRVNTDAAAPPRRDGASPPVAPAAAQTPP